MEEFDDLVDGQGHVVRVLEGVVGPFDGTNSMTLFSAIPRTRSMGIISSFVPEDEDIFGKIEVFVVTDIEALQIIHKCRVDFHLAFRN